MKPCLCELDFDFEFGFGRLFLKRSLFPPFVWKRMKLESRKFSYCVCLEREWNKDKYAIGFK